MVSNPDLEQQCSNGLMNLRGGDIALKMRLELTALSLLLPGKTWKLYGHKQETRITVEEIQDILSTESTATDLIPHKQASGHKQCERWVPHGLTDQQKMVRMQWCLFMLCKCNVTC